MNIFFIFYFPQNDEDTSLIRIKVVAAHSLTKKDIFGNSDPYVKVDVNTIVGDVNIDSMVTKTKRKVMAQQLLIKADKK